MNVMKLIKKKMVKFCCCSGCLQQATCVFGVLDICFASYAIFLATSFYSSKKYRIDLYLFSISVSTLTNVIVNICIVINSINIVSCILLFYGNQSEKRRNYLCPYVVIGFIRLICLLFVIILLIFNRKWEILLNCLVVTVYIICSLHVVGERDKELENQLSSKLYLSNTSPKIISIGHFDEKQNVQPVSPGKSKKVLLKSSKIKPYHLKYNNKECEELNLKNINNSQPRNSISTINSNTLSSSIDFVSDNPGLSQLPLAIKVRKSTLPGSKSRRPRSSMSLTSLDAAIPESRDPLLTKSVENMYLQSPSLPPRFISSAIETDITNSKLFKARTPKGKIKAPSSTLPWSTPSRPQSSLSLIQLHKAASKSIDPLLTKSVENLRFSSSTSPKTSSTKSVEDLHFSSSTSPKTSSSTLGTDTSSSKKYFVQNPCDLKGNISKEVKVDVINEQNCKLCQLCPPSCVMKENVGACELQKYD